MTTELKKVGFFHFGEAEKGEPLAALKESLKRKQEEGEDLSEGLVVVPEAFNGNGGYWAQRSRFSSITKPLQQIGSEFGVALVAGLVDEGDRGAGYSCAYLIDHGVFTILSRKMGDDGSKNYSPCRQNCDTLIEHRGVCVAALVCMDADQGLGTPKRQLCLIKQMRAAKAAHRILCVTACFANHNTVGLAEGLTRAEIWPADITVIVANSDHTSPSVARIGPHPVASCNRKEGVTSTWDLNEVQLFGFN